MSCTKRWVVAIAIALVAGGCATPPKPSTPSGEPKPVASPAAPATKPDKPVAPPTSEVTPAPSPEAPEAKIPGLPTAPPIPEPDASPSVAPGKRPQKPDARPGVKPAPGTKPAPTKPAPVAGLPELLARAEQRYAQAGTLVADFAQTIASPNSASRKPKESSGTIQIRYPNQFRWETLKPDPTLVVSDGKTFWQYTPPFDESEPGQVIEGSFAKFRNTLAGSLLAGNFHALVPITETAPAQFELSPRRGTAGSIRTVRFAIDPEKLAMRSLTLIHADGTTTVISLSNVALGAKVETSKFRFIAPPGTDRVKAE